MKRVLLKSGKPLAIIVCAVICACVAVFFSACGKGGGNDVIKTYDGKASERKLVTRIVKTLVETHTDLKFEVGDEMTDVNMFNELKAGNIDIMLGYDGTLLTTYLKQNPSDVPEGETMYDYVNRTASEEFGVRLLDMLGINNTYALGVRQSVAEQYSLNTNTDLAAVAPELIFGAEHEFFSEEGSMKFTPFTNFYGLKFKEARALDIGIKYSAIESGNLDVMVVYTTDGLNKRAGLKVLLDDRKYFPDYNGAMLVRDEFFDKYKDIAPDLQEVMSRLNMVLTNEIMTDMTYQTDVEGKDFDEVARTFMESKGLL